METLTNGVRLLDENGDDHPAAYRQAINANARAMTGDGLLQQGVFGSSWKGTFGIVEGTGELEFSTNAEAAWLGVSTILTRIYQAPFTTFLRPPTLPAAAKFMSVGIELAAAGNGEGTVSAVSGVAKTTEAEALASPAAATGHMRLYDVVIKNTAGVYSIPGASAIRDRRPWARGASASLSRTSGSIALPEAFVLIDATNLALRVECSGVPVQLWLHASYESTSGTPKLAFNFWANGAPVSEGEAYSDMPAAASSRRTADFFFSFVPPAPGSYLFQPTVFARSTAVELISTAAVPIFFSVREDLRHSANNGTS